MNSLLTSLLAMRALLFVGELFVGSTLVMNLAWLATAFIPHRASLRHLIWLTAFGALLLLPLAAMVIPSHIVLQHPIAAALPQETMTAAVPDSGPAAKEISNSGASLDAASDAVLITGMDVTPPAMPVVQPAITPTVPRTSVFAIQNWHASWIAGIFLVLWLAGLLVNGLRGAVAVFGLRVLLRQSVPHSFPTLALPELARCRLRLFTGHGPGPVTWGFVRPVILLPQDAVEWPEDRLTAVLRHELAHVRRHDSLVQALSLLTCALYWPNPLVWLGARALRREAELAADDAVLASGVTPSVYAGELVRLATEFRGRHVSFSGIGMAGQSALEERVRSVLAPNPHRSGVTSMDAVKIACLALTATASLAMLRPDIAVAQSSPASSVTAAPLPPVPATPARAAEAATPAAPAAPPAPPAPPSVRDGNADSGQADLARQQRTLTQQRQILARQAQQEAAQAKREAAQEAAEAKREAELDAAQARRDAEQEAAEAKREGEQEGREAAAEARREVEEQMVQVRAAQRDAAKAIADAHIDQTVARAMAEAQPQIDAAVANAMKQVKPEIDKAMVGVEPRLQRAILQAKIGEVVAKAMAKAQPQIDAAIAKAQAHANYRVDIQVDPSGRKVQEEDDMPGGAPGEKTP